jgi:hypothetical protein
VETDVSVAVLTPVYRPTESDEEISFRHLETVLGGYDRILVIPEGLAFKRRGFRLETFPQAAFESVATYSRLLLSAAFYERFAAYDYVLIYQLDCLVFRDELAEWCEAGYDYIGAPWFHCPSTPQRGLSRTGNGGLSLRRVGAFLDVLSSRRRPAPYGTDLWTTQLPDLALWPFWRRWWKTLRVLRETSRGVAEYTSAYSLNEDHFWSDRARLFEPRFRIAPAEVALRFAFETAPRTCFQMHPHLPFGCHAWRRWDRSFWQPHLIS